MRSDAIDQLLSNYLRLPVRVSWRGALGDSARGIFTGGRVELAGVSILATPFDRLVFESDRFQLAPGIPARILVDRPRVEITLEQRQLDRALRRLGVPFRLGLHEEGIEFEMKVVGVALTRTLTTLEMRGGWLTLKPIEAEVLGLRNRLARLFRAYLPIPRLAPQTRLTAIHHEPGYLHFELGLEDFEEEINAGLVVRLHERFVPFVRLPGRSSR